MVEFLAPKLLSYTPETTGRVGLKGDVNSSLLARSRVFVSLLVRRQMFCAPSSVEVLCHIKAGVYVRDTVKMSRVLRLEK